MDLLPVVRRLIENINSEHEWLKMSDRDFSSAFPAKLIIEKDWLKTENWCRPRRHGNILQDEFSPYPKNPLIANFFTVMGRAETIGSGVKNLYQFTPIYSDGGKPVLRDVSKMKKKIKLSYDKKTSLWRFEHVEEVGK